MDDSYASIGSLRRPLAEAPSFSLGPLKVEPALLSVLDGAERIRLEPRVMKVLVALHDACGGVVSRDALIADCWKGRIVSDDSVQRCIAALRRLAARTEPAPFAIETIARVGYRLTTEEQGAGETAAPAEAPAPRPANLFRRPFAALAAGVVIAVVAALTWTFLLRPSAPYVAMSSFEAVSRRPDHVALARALPEALASDLAGWSVPVRFNPRREGSAARPAYIIEGAVSAPGGRTEALVRIVDGRGGETVWSQVFAVDADRIDELRPKISTAIGSAFTGPVRLFGRDRARAGQLAAKLRIAGHLRAYRPVEALHEAEGLLRTAGDDPGALALFAGSAAEALFDVPESERTALWRKARDAARRAVRLDPSYGEAWRAEARLVPASDFAGRLRILRAGVRRAPDSASLQNALAEALSAAGQARESARWRQRVAAADPLSRDHAQGLVLAHADQADRITAYGELAQARARWPGDPYWDVVELYLAARFLDGASLDRARARLDGQLNHTPEFARRLELLSAALHDRSPEKAAAFGRHCLDHPQEMTTLCAYALAALGRRDEAFGVLEVFLADAFVPPSPAERERHFLRLPWASSKTSVLFRASFAEMRADPRMWSLFRRLGLVDYWRTSGEWPDFCASRSRPVDCLAMARAAT